MNRAKSWGTGFFEKKTEKTSNVIREEVVKIGELASLEYNYTKLAKRVVSSKISQMLPFISDDELFYSFDGVIKLGIDCTQANIRKDDEERKIFIYLPPVKILSHEIDESSYTVYDQSGDFSAQVLSEYREEDKQEQEERIKENGLYERARKNAEDTIKTMLTFETEDAESGESIYTITFVDDPFEDETETEGTEEESK